MVLTNPIITVLIRGLGSRVLGVEGLGFTAAHLNGFSVEVLKSAVSHQLSSKVIAGSFFRSPKHQQAFRVPEKIGLGIRAKS